MKQMLPGDHSIMNMRVVALSALTLITFAAAVGGAIVWLIS